MMKKFKKIFARFWLIVTSLFVGHELIKVFLAHPLLLVFVLGAFLFSGVTTWALIESGMVEDS